MIDQAELDTEVKGLLDELGFTQQDGPQVSSFIHKGQFYNYNWFESNHDSIGMFLFKFRQYITERDPNWKHIIWRSHPKVDVNYNGGPLGPAPSVSVHCRFLISNKEIMEGLEVGEAAQAQEAPAANAQVGGF